MSLLQTDTASFSDGDNHKKPPFAISEEFSAGYSGVFLGPFDNADRHYADHNALESRPVDGVIRVGSEMDKLREMEIFVAIVDRGSFTGAADKVGMSAAAVSRAVSSLESRLGTPLLARTTRTVRPTDAGMTYLEACRKVLDSIADAEATIAADRLNPVGTLTISAPVLFGQRYVAPLVNAFALRYPDISINAVYVDRTTRLLEEGVDIAIRVGHLGDSSTFAVPLGFVQRRTYAAPSYLAAHGEPLHPRDLANHHCVSFTGVSLPLEWVYNENGSRLPVRLDRKSTRLNSSHT